MTIDQRGALAIAGLFALFFALVGAMIAVDCRKTRECESRGGHMEEYGEPTYVVTGQIATPVRNTRCVEASR